MGRASLHKTNQLRILELGSYIAPAYAGMILAEQGHQVTKWSKTDPIHDLINGDQLWDWINAKKKIEDRHFEEVLSLKRGDFDIIIDNVRADTWQKLHVSPENLANKLDVVWVSLRADDDKRSFDIIAQARAWGDFGTLPFFIGDTAAGLWLAFKALATGKGHHIIRHATCLAKLVEGEAQINMENRATYPFDQPNTYGVQNDIAYVVFKDEKITEPMRDYQWRLRNLPNEGGRFTV